ncbi:MAG: N-acetylmuramoyl-L-alanine amidase [Deltaproteobacteria bacterium]|nr:N-acetylmuramoyl-L-alanine amidase [Deltaproteobacteria bacterium]MBW2112573.1 N-acetylmuramoyl-L-alanine amidase [Deltaproteobacteria bacterium]MBW2354796.1 N-acetylmuramoyl-L-alanine amidase [Deltaproteobacteria bacterium]
MILSPALARDGSITQLAPFNVETWHAGVSQWEGLSGLNSYSIGNLHPSEYTPLFVTASSGSILELYRQILSEMGIHTASSSRAVLLRLIRREIQEIVNGT